MAIDSFYEMRGALVVALEETKELLIQFSPMADDPEIGVSIPAGAVGQFIAQVASEHQKIALKSDDDAGAFAPLALTDARPFEAPDGTPVLLLQFENSFELAVLLTKTNAGKLSLVAEQIGDELNSTGRIGRN